jgi:hypothetical protein
VNIQRATAGGGERHVLVLHQHHKQTLFGRAPRPRCAPSEERMLTVLYIAAIESEKKKCEPPRFLVFEFQNRTQQCESPSFTITML